MYSKTSWKQKPVEVCSKINKWKKEFDKVCEAEAFLSAYTYAFVFSRTGFEYQLDDLRIFIEEIEGLPPSIEVLAPSKEKLNHFFTHVIPAKILSDSVPKLVENKFLNDAFSP